VNGDLRSFLEICGAVAAVAFLVMWFALLWFVLSCRRIEKEMGRSFKELR
jgi:hypothetical protein